MAIWAVVEVNVYAVARSRTPLDIMTTILALLIDRWLGEPPNRLHPVVWMGYYLEQLGRDLPAHAPTRALILGAAYWLVGATLIAVMYSYIAFLLTNLPAWLEVSVTAMLLKPLFALRLLLREVSAVETALKDSVEQGRERLRRIVRGDTARLDRSEIRESSLISLAENFTDSVIAPLFWFALFGLPGAAVYRFANTADAMWGYRGRWEWAGKFAARADDLLNLIPARIAGLALLLVGPGAMRLFPRLPSEAARTESPNQGWTMGALALSRNLLLRKPNGYVLNASGHEPSEADIGLAVHHVELTAWIVALMFVCTTTLFGFVE